MESEPKPMDVATFAVTLHTLCTRHHGTVTRWTMSLAALSLTEPPSEILHTYGLAADVVFDTEGDRLDAMTTGPIVGLSATTIDEHVHFQPLSLTRPGG